VNVLKVIWAPWRIRYVESPKPAGCFLCEAIRSEDDARHYVVYRGSKCFIIMNLFPYNPGHLMIAPYRHLPSLEDLSDEELYDLIKLTKFSLKILKKAFNPHGFNIGVNIGSVAGAGIEDHVHVHVVPRWSGDTNFMPLLADVKVIPQALEETYKKLKKALEEI